MAVLMRTRASAVTSVLIERLEQRQFLSVTFTPGPLTAPGLRPDRQLGTTGGFVPIEPADAVNPTNPANVIASSQHGLRISTNGGATFGGVVNFPDPAGTNTQHGDTDLAFDAVGRLFWLNLDGNNNSSHGGIAAAQINPTTGATITSVFVSTPAAVTEDKGAIAADANLASPFANNVYIVWTRFPDSGSPEVFFSRSTTNGASWTAPTQLSSSATQGFCWPADVAVAANGDVYVAWHANGTFGSASGTAGRVMVRRSVDGGASFAAAVQVITPGGSDVSANQQTSLGTIPGAQFWTQGAVGPWVLPDPVRPGNVYIIENDDPNNTFGNGDDGDIVIARSTNNGANWTTSTVSAGPSNSFQLFPTAAIDKFGDIVVAWYDNRRGQLNASSRFKLDIFATYSTDGGVSFAPDFMVNDASNPFDPDPGAFNRFAGPPPTTRIGEYFGISLYGGTAHVAWNGNVFSGTTPTSQQVWYDDFAVSGALTVNGDDGGPVADTIIIQDLSGNSDWFEVLVNGTRQYAGLKSAITTLTINAGVGDDTINVLETAPTTNVFLNTGPGADAVNVNTDNAGSATVNFAASDDLGTLAIGTAGRVNLVPNGNNFLRMSGISISGGGVLNLNDNDFIFDYSGGTPIDLFRGLINSGFNGGGWNGTTGILTALGSSTRGIGYAEAAGVLGPSGGIFDGQSVDGTTILGKYTYFGDASLDGQVDVTDLGRLATGWQSTQNWEGGDFNYSHFTDVTDLGLLATNWQQGIGSPLGRTIASRPIAAETTAPARRTSLVETVLDAGYDQV